MKTVLTALALVATLGCSRDYTPLPDGWAEKAASNWAVELGDNSPKVSCSYTEYYRADGIAYSDCSINILGQIHKVYCRYPEMKCSLGR